jgi:hypothetical protein
VRMNSASEKVLRMRSARGPTLRYDLRFRRNTVHCVAQFGSLLGLHAWKTLYPGRVATRSVVLTNGVFEVLVATFYRFLRIQKATTGS